MIFTRGVKQDTHVEDRQVDFDKLFAHRFSTNHGPSHMEDVLFFKRLMKKLENPRHQTTMLMLERGMRPNDIAKIYSVHCSTITRYDMKAIEKAMRELISEDEHV